ncbi:YkgJ family cysteine cluster protein [Flavobacteriales bacterium]|nr:YkgJ family cysteine cluster protein [Flavobacteriales bacterium]
MEYQDWLELPKQTKDKNKKFITKLKNKKPKNLDDMFHEKHEEVFEDIECLKCGNCCKTTSPIFREVDIKRIAKKLRMKEPDFIDYYLKIDGDGDYVLQEAPCAFFDEQDNTCGIYDFRPAACGEYPHTNRKNMFQILDLTLINTEVCPAVARIITELEKVTNMDRKLPRTRD